MCLQKTCTTLAALLFVWSAGCPLSLRADDGEEFFESKIRPVLVDYCYECHSSDADDASGGLRVDTREGIRRGGETGPAVVPGDVDESLLISAVEYRDLEMPPDEKLDDEIIANLKKWIRMGAPDPRDGDATMPDASEDTAAAEPLWSLQPVVAVEPPPVQDNQWPRSGVDHFVLAKLEQEGLSAVQAATPQNLIRRVSFDLTGLPPAVDDVESFAADASEQAFEQYVDHLIASPQFGERWARHWLDVARYGESAGSSRDVLMLYSWRYRDYVIDAFNHDLPYDEFIRQQIAGDLLPYSDEAERQRHLIATGLLAIGSKSLNGGNLALDIADDQIDVVGKAVMGLTVSCARCHDHKFDPIPTADYYALAGIFRSTKTFYGGSTKRPASFDDRLKVYLPLDEDADELGRQLGELEKKLADVGKKLKAAEKKSATLKKSLPQDWESIDVSDAASATDDDTGSDADAQQSPAADAAGSDQPVVSDKVRRQVASYRNVLKSVAALNTQIDELKNQKKAMPELQWAFAVQDEQKVRDWPIQVRGEKSKNGDVVPRGFLSCVSLPDAPVVDGKTSGRLQLAEWLTHPEHPLTARVMVNRVWQHLFGRGLVESVNNFGRTGGRPTHPELLDWLADRFVHHHNWSVKSLVKELVMTKTYQLSTEHNAANWEKDPANQWLWRMNRRRLEAEAIRDAMLAASGNLNLQRPQGSLVQEIGEGEVGRNINTGPLKRPFPYRSVYLPIIRGLLPEMLKVFDFPEAGNPAAQRSVTNVPLQSLYLMNSPFVQEQSAGIAGRVVQSASDDRERIRFAWLMCLNRAPQDAEIDDAVAFVNEFRTQADDQAQVEKGDKQTPEEWRLLCQSLLASAEFRFLE
jgi:cytochrome c553